MAKGLIELYSSHEGRGDSPRRKDYDYSGAHLSGGIEQMTSEAVWNNGVSGGMYTDG